MLGSFLSLDSFLDSSPVPKDKDEAQDRHVRVKVRSPSATSWGFEMVTTTVSLAIKLSSQVSGKSKVLSRSCKIRQTTADSAAPEGKVLIRVLFGPLGPPIVTCRVVDTFTKPLGCFLSFCRIVDR